MKRRFVGLMHASVLFSACLHVHARSWTNTRRTCGRRRRWLSAHACSTKGSHKFQYEGALACVPDGVHYLGQTDSRDTRLPGPIKFTMTLLIPEATTMAAHSIAGNTNPCPHA